MVQAILKQRLLPVVPAKNNQIPYFEGKEVKIMPFGMGRAGWFVWPHMAYWMRCWNPWSSGPYWSPFPPLTREEEEALLEDQAKMLEDQLVQIKKRLEELKKEGKK